jgi:hypothetical protein
MGKKRLLRLSARTAYALTNLSWRLHVQNDAPGVGLDYVRWRWTVSTDRLQKELGYTFKHSSLAAVQSYLGPAPRVQAPPPSAQPPTEPDPERDQEAGSGV